ncbi:hypothetical protein VPH35_001996 [Triticum aestivum]|uniref:zinc finger protein ZAT3 n=1 Tax=Triticum aestivum TaxID=4565 RepID=UPI0008450B28|nr:zinc finger protein ZAT3-like [Triticum aestivum]
MEPPPEPAAPPPPPPPPPHPHDTTLTLTLALPPPGLASVLISPKPGARRPRPEGGASPRPRCSPIGDTPPCTECGKRFPSWKALFGHMRCHPERQWRGITPPPAHFCQGVAAAPVAPAGQFTVQEREVASSLLMLSSARPGASKGKKVVNAAAITRSGMESCGTSACASVVPGPANCDEHNCSVCDRGFASGQALGGHKRCHWHRACSGVVVIAATGSSGSPMSTDETAILDLNLPPPGPPPVRRSDQGSSLNDMLDLKLGYYG